MKIYRFYGLKTAIDLLRPNAKYETDGTKFLKWNDDRPCPSWEEVMETLDKLKTLEDSIKTVWLDKHVNICKKIYSNLNQDK